MRSFWSRMGPSSMTDVFTWRGKYRHGLKLREDGNVRMEAEIGVMCTKSQGMSRIAGCHQKLKEAKKYSSLESSEGARPCQNLDLRLLASRTVKDYISVVLSHSVCGTVLKQSLENNTKHIWKKKMLHLPKCCSSWDVRQKMLINRGHTLKPGNCVVPPVMLYTGLYMHREINLERTPRLVFEW